jgi:hypothetical protein
MTPHKKRKVLKREKAKRRPEGVAFTCSDAGPARCGECGADVHLLFRADLAVEAPNGFVIPGFGKCECGASVMSVIGPPQPSGFLEVLTEALSPSAPVSMGVSTH